MVGLLNPDRSPTWLGAKRQARKPDRKQRRNRAAAEEAEGASFTPGVNDTQQQRGNGQGGESQCRGPGKAGVRRVGRSPRHDLLLDRSPQIDITSVPRLGAGPSVSAEFSVVHTTDNSAKETPGAPGQADPTGSERPRAHRLGRQAPRRTRDP